MYNIQEKFNDSLYENKLICTKSDLDEYRSYGLVFKDGNNFFDRSFKKLKIVYPGDFNIDLSNEISNSLKLSKKYHTKRIYCMSKNLYDSYKNLGYIVHHNDSDYFMMYGNEEWLINLIDGGKTNEDI